MTPLPPPARRHLEAAEGWLSLGDHLAANEELDSITARLRAPPDVLKLRFEVYAKAGKWQACADIARAVARLVPGETWGYLALAQALRRAPGGSQTCLPLILPVPIQEAVGVEVGQGVSPGWAGYHTSSRSRSGCWNVGLSGDRSTAADAGAWLVVALARSYQVQQPAQDRIGLKPGSGSCRQGFQPEPFGLAVWAQPGHGLVGLGPDALELL
jgi:hypothetical protein